MKRLVLTLAVCLFSLGILEAQNIWKPIDVPGTFLGVSSDGSIFTYFDDYFAYGEIVRSQDEGETWQVVLSFETESDISFLYNIEHGFTISEDGRVFVVAEHQVEGYLDYYCLFYSDDNGDTWQQTTGIPFFLVSGLVEFDGIAAPTNDIIVAWSSGGDYIWSIDGGATWDYTYYAPPHDGINLPHSLCEVIVNASGDIYASYLLYSDRTAAIARTNISHMSTWQGREMLGCTEIWDMEFGSDGNAYIGYIRDTTWNCGDVNYIQGDSYYVFAGQSIAVSDNGVVYKLRYIDDTHAVLNYSQHDANNFFDVGETMVISQSSSSLIHDGNIYKGRDNYLYFHGNGQYWKSVPDADHILDYDYFPLVHEGNDRQKWNVVYMASMNYPNDYFTETQSIRDNITLDGVDYKLVWKEDVYDSKRIAGAVREEDKRVYYRMYWQQSYQNEVLLYDFNLTVGDTVSVGWSDYRLIVLEESQVQVNGTMRRQLGLAMYFDDGTIGEVEEYWIEGVGSTYGFLNSGYEGWVGAFVHLLCYHENGNLVWDNEEFDDCVMNSDGAPATFAPQGAEWYFDVFNPWGTHPEYQRFFVEGDTIIQGHQCSIIDQRFVDTGHDGGEYVYEEDNKVYWFNPTTNAFTTLYDFDAEAGESWDYEVGDCTHQVTVDSVGSATWNGHTYRTQWVRFYEENLPIYYSGKIMEGIGYERGLFPSVYVCNGWEIFDASEIEYLRCYVNDGEMLYHEGGYDCEQTTVTPPSHPEWYYEILNDDGTITYQYMYQAGDTIINDEPTQILVKINTLYDKGLR
ncbi:MAG: exo-alpha-sialidase, partial [Prevotella sp.]|nr:exo-alpha-sialidase [Prevotella sp.]